MGYYDCNLFRLCGAGRDLVYLGRRDAVGKFLVIPVIAGLDQTMPEAARSPLSDLIQSKRSLMLGEFVAEAADG
jgi:hypothetical protein